MLWKEYKNVSILSYPQHPSHVLKYFWNQEGFHKTLSLKRECDAPVFLVRICKPSLSSKITLAPETSLLYFSLAAVLQSLGGSAKPGLLCRKCIEIPDIGRRKKHKEDVLHSGTDAHPVLPLARCPQHPILCLGALDYPLKALSGP